MLDSKYIKENVDQVKEAMKSRGFNANKKIDRIIELGKEIMEDQEKANKINKISEEIANLKGEARAEKIMEVKQIKEEIASDKLAEKRLSLLKELPNIPKKDVKVGKDERDNEILREVGERPQFDFVAKDYMELGETLDIIDVKRAAKVSGSRFGYLKGSAAMLEFALIQYALETLTKEGFIPVVPPVLVSEKAMKAMGYLAQAGKRETYHFDKDNLYLVGTSEQSIGPMHMDEVLEDLSKKYVSFSACFRREAGSYGKDTKGILRVHQFDKLEMFVFAKPEDSDKEHDNLLAMQERLMKGLKLPYRVVKLCTGDIGHPSARTYDIETWIPSENTYRETHSTSNCTDYQSRGLNIKYKNKDGKLEFAHTLNGTAFAIGRTIIAIMENYQTKEGEIAIPEVLQKYMGISRIR